MAKIGQGRKMCKIFFWSPGDTNQCPLQAMFDEHCKDIGSHWTHSSMVQ